MKRIISIAFLAIFYLNSFSQQKLAPNIFWVHFSDKYNNPYSIEKPNEYLSQKAIERRKRQKIAISENDLPINPKYIDSLSKLGLKILNKSKWFNSISVYSENTKLINQLTNISFVAKEQDYTGKFQDYGPSKEIDIRFISGKINTSNSLKSIDYGYSGKQIFLHNGQALHKKGFQGQGLTIAVIDAGFIHADTLPAFDSIWTNNQIKGSWDFVNNSKLIFDGNSHGMKVLSILAGNIPGKLIGTAPKADYWLLRSEDAGSEYLVEEINWISAAEFADSVGVDVISSSLGYNDFDDTSLNHKISQLDGKSIPVSIAADIAASKGILVVNSAGNEGRNKWKYITAPADALNILAVGAVSIDSAYASFSSIGPTYDKRVKPDVVALGFETIVQGTFGEITSGNGTSFACPVIAGLAACLWQSLPDFTNTQLINAIKMNSNKYEHPDSLLGYGIPDFNLAFYFPDPSLNDSITNKLTVFPNPFKFELNIEINSDDEDSKTIEIYNLLGRKVFMKKTAAKKLLFESLLFSELKSLQSGVYVIKLTTKKHSYTQKLIKS